MIDIIKLQEIKRCSASSRAALAGLLRRTDRKKEKSTYRDHATAKPPPAPSHTMLTVPSNDLADGDKQAQIAHMPANHNNQGPYPLKNESISLGNETF